MYFMIVFNNFCNLEFVLANGCMCKCIKVFLVLIKRKMPRVIHSIEGRISHWLSIALRRMNRCVVFPGVRDDFFVLRMLRSIEATDSILCYLHLIDFQQPNSYLQPSNLIELPFARKQLVIKYTLFLIWNRNFCPVKWR